MYAQHWSLAVLSAGIFRLILRPLWILGQYLFGRQPNSRDGAHVYNIVFRNNFDPISLEISLTQFMLSFQEVRDSDFVLRNNVYLLFVDPKQAVFIEVDDGLKLWESQHSAFYKIAQYRCAKRVITLPLDQFIAVVEYLPDPRERLNFVHFLLRSGSTLLMQMFEATGKCVTYAEPDEFGRTFSRFKADLSDDEKIMIWRTVGKYMCKYDSNNNEGVTYIAKIPADFLVGDFELFASAFPDSKHVMLYRELQPYLYSATTAISRLPFMCLIDTLLTNDTWVRRIVMLHLLVRNHIAFLKDTRLIEKNLWRCKEGQIFQFVYVRNLVLKYFIGRSNVPAIKYEDIISNEETNLARIFDHFGIPTTLVPKALKAKLKDSQEHTPLARSKLARCTQYEHLRTIAAMPADLKCDIDELCDVMGLPKLEDDQRLRGTMTLP